MAEALFNERAPSGWWSGSAGTEPAAQVRPEAVAVMREIGLDISAQRPRHFRDALDPGLALVVGLCEEAACPVVPGVRREHWPLPNPAGREVAFFRQIRDELRSRVADLVHRLDAGRA